jgi:hypothetical protein
VSMNVGRLQRRLRRLLDRQRRLAGEIAKVKSKLAQKQQRQRVDRGTPQPRLWWWD